MSPIKSAVAMALASVAAAASAYALDASSSLASGTVVLNIGGSTAIDNTLLASETALESVSPGGFCAAGSIDVYQIGNPSNRLTYCTGSSTLPAGLSGVPIAIFKESNVGSFNGPGPLVGVATTAPSGYQLLFLNAGTVGVTGSSVLTAANCGTVTSSTLGASFNTFTLHQCSATATNIQVAANPTAGIADVEANILHSPQNTPFPVNDLTLLSGKPGLDVVWTPVVTKNLYYALQTAEHLSDGTVIASCNTVNNDAPTCAPSLSKTQFASILVASPALKSWNQFVGLSNPSGDNNIYICRRDPGSGTEASYEQFFLGARCGGAVNPAGSLLAPSAENFTTVWENGSTGGVRNCLGTFFEGGTNTGFTNTTRTKSYPGGEWAVGYAAETTPGNLVLSSSNKCNDCFRAIAIDGVLPTLDNVVNGFDAFFSTDVFYTTSTGPDAAGSGASALLFTTMEGRVGHPVFTAGTNTAYTGTPWGNGGDLAPAGTYAATNVPTIPATSSTVTSNPTNAWSKSFTGAVANCDTAVLQLSAPNGKAPLQMTLLGSGNVNHN